MKNVKLLILTLLCSGALVTASEDSNLDVLKPTPSFIDLRTNNAKIEYMKVEGKKAMNQAWSGLGDFADIDNVISTIEIISDKKFNLIEKQELISKYKAGLLEGYNKAFPATINLTCAMTGVAITAVSIIAYMTYQHFYPTTDTDKKIN